MIVFLACLIVIVVLVLLFVIAVTMRMSGIDSRNADPQNVEEQANSNTHDNLER